MSRKPTYKELRERLGYESTKGMVEALKEPLERGFLLMEIPHRQYAMAQDFLGGATLCDIGIEYGITRERVRQLLIKACVKILKKEGKC